MRSLAGLAAAVLLTTLAACTTTTTDTSPPGGTPDARSSRNAEPADPDRRARLRLELASAYFSRGQSQTALDEVKQAIAVKPNMPEAYTLMGLILARLGDPRQAEDSFKR